MTVNPVQPQAASSTTNGSSSALPTSGSLNNMFLQLLVAQLQNQSPLDPMDPTQFVGQLAQFSELSEVTNIDQTLQQLTSSSSSTHTGSSPSGGATSRNDSALPSYVAPSALVSAAVSAAQSAGNNSASGSPAVLNRKIEGVY